MAGNDVEMTHNEMWDDSALIESWNEALDEYKKYHSIHAKGGKLKDLDLQEKTEDKPQTIDDTQTQVVDQPEITDNGAEGADKTKGVMVGDSSTDVRVQADSTGVPIAAKANDPQGPAIMGPQSLLGSVQDEGLKRLLMSWYYAGYYTGLYEGQQQQQQQQQ
ncbi:hypothetical protein CORC01_13063 [Colletotrichum orchidophilum]|uniref:Survival Motor Neuron Gemin2-binding domain-containing protein n=1 Tax=Colletotrichum orchidophilum TaxID=1209926 RepID=A0A1G4AR23_9PEZI|nr:uncharacterized protein CORC01_13063 [Colletotrichum orchidophilum]OHE91627.1 hypothetical protein CORC01_13063 [Colletotrichum orchidophilum]